MAFMLRVVVKGLLLFAGVNVLLAAWGDLGYGRVSAYNGLYPGRPRFPFGENPRETYNFSLFNLDAMFASHEISADRMAGEYRIFLVGDSSVWGTLLPPEQTLAGQLNASGMRTPDGRVMRFYNLGYPTLSLTKDLLLLDRALVYEPDLVVWLVTLEAFPRQAQLPVPLVANNPRLAQDLLSRYGLPGGESLPAGDLWQRTLVGQRKNIADVIRLQLYGVLWAATGIDQAYPVEYARAQVDLTDDRTFQGLERLTPEELAFDVLRAGQMALGDVPLLLVNEPILISQGQNSEIRYNFYYPRWAYDQYRQWLSAEAAGAGVAYLDAWDLVPAESFTNSAIHIDQSGTARLAEQIQQAVLQISP